MTQYGFLVDQSRCTGCHVCAVACKDWQGIPPGPAKPMRVMRVEKGNWPTPELHFLPVFCWHCQNPPCVAAANGAMFKEPKYGAVLIDPAQKNSPNLKAAWDACPYGAISFDSDLPTANAFKCTMCVDKLENGEKPVCVMGCPLRALDFDTIDNLKAKYGSLQQIDELPSAAATQPAVVFIPRHQRKQLIPYDTSKATTLWANRDPLPPVYGSATDLQIPDGVVRHGKLVLKSGTLEESKYTTDVE